MLLEKGEVSLSPFIPYALLNANNNICSLLNLLLVDYYPKSI